MYGPHNDNLAYDFSLFDTPEEPKKKKEMPLEEKQLVLIRNSVGKRGNAFKTLLAIVCAVAVAFMLLGSKVSLSELSSNIALAEMQYEQATKDNIRLQAQLDTQMTLNKVEEAAVNDLGLQKVQKSQIKYVDINTENIAEVEESSSNIFVSIGDWFNDVLEYLGF